MKYTTIGKSSTHDCHENTDDDDNDDTEPADRIEHARKTPFFLLPISTAAAFFLKGRA